MQWLDFGVSIAAGADLALALVSCLYLGAYARTAETPARRLGAAALSMVNSGLALEAGLFLALAAPASEGTALRTAAAVLVRGALLGSAALMAALLLRAASRR